MKWLHPGVDSQVGPHVSEEVAFLVKSLPTKSHCTAHLRFPASFHALAGGWPAVDWINPHTASWSNLETALNSETRPVFIQQVPP